MKSNSTTVAISYAALGIFLLYALFSVGAPGFLFSVALGLVVFSVIDSIEVATAIVILTGLLFKYLFGPVTKRLIKSTTEGFGTTEGGQSISNRVRKIGTTTEPVGTYTNPFVEGFADASSATNGQVSGEQKSDVTAAESKPAPLESSKKDKAEEKFTNNNQADGLFKLGEIPTEAKGGSHIDQGTTLMNAISALKPDQIKAMTDDTRKLLDTQKSLMSMLQTMKPMLNDGKDLMNTFQQMFGTDGTLKANQ